ncbi:uncharacterized protein LOC142486275 isoform X4 [Ascaphus truei]|uniref:uncharacterized protein LOC142486275 isoform X4 n=1 Tax=Ascaphus truei TaxID=8439 RepID=UPI003F5ABD02
MEEQRNEGCQVYGFLEVNKVAGNFHFAPGKSFQQSHVHVHAVEIHDLQSFGLDNINMTHHIKHLSFGRDYPGIVNPLDGTSVDASQASMMFQYFVKIFPTVYVKVDGECPKMAAHGRTPFLPRGVTKMAAAGTRDLGKAEEETVFDPTSLDPERCESCYGAETEDIRCCNSFDDVREAYRRKGWAFKTPDSIAQCKREASARRWKSRGTRAAKCTGF